MQWMARSRQRGCCLDGLRLCCMLPGGVCSSQALCQPGATSVRHPKATLMVSYHPPYTYTCTCSFAECRTSLFWMNVPATLLQHPECLFECCIPVRHVPDAKRYRVRVKGLVWEVGRCSALPRTQERPPSPVHTTRQGTYRR